MRRRVFREGKSVEKLSPERHEVIKWRDGLVIEERGRIHARREAIEAWRGDGRMNWGAIPNRVMVPKWKGKRF